MFQYRPFSERTPDTQYRNLLAVIRDSGEDVDTQQEHPARKRIGHLLRFPLANGFPLITERDLVADPSQFSMAIGELCAFLNGAQTLEEMKDFGCGWWARWVTEKKCAKRGLAPGDLGPGSYGAVWRRFPTAAEWDEDKQAWKPGVPFDQISSLISEIGEMPHLRTLRVTNWIPQYIPRGGGRLQKVVVAPCHGDFHVHINTRTRVMDLMHVQRSADAPVGLVFNFIQYAALLIMLAQVTAYDAREVVFFVDDAHIFHRQMPDVEALLATAPTPFPGVLLDPDVKSIFDFRPRHFAVYDYQPQGPRRAIWTPV